MFIFSPELLRAARIEKDFTRERLAVTANSSYPAISLYENGYRVPSREKLLRIAAALGVSPRDLCVPDPAFEEVAQ